MVKYINKLVRDQVPLIIKRSGQRPKVRFLEDEEFKKELARKLKEEVSDFIEWSKVDDLIDILEIIYAYAKLYNISFYELDRLRIEKANEKGSYNKRTYLRTIRDLEEKPL